MRNLFLLLCLVAALLSLDTHAAKIGDDTLIVGKPGSASDKTIKLGASRLIRSNETTGNLEFSNDSGSLWKKVGSGTGAGAAGGVNILSNASFEDGLVNWTNSGGTLTQETYTNSVEGNTKFARFVATAAGQYIETDLTTFADNLSGGGMADFKYTQGDNAFQYLVIDGSAATISGPYDLVDLTVWLKAESVVFDLPSQGKLRIISTAAGTIDIDDAYLGSNKNIVPIGKQANFLGSLEWQPTTNCQWGLTTVTFSDFPADVDCDDNARIVTGLAQDSSAGQLPQITFPSLKKGHYKIVYSGGLYRNNTSVYGAHYRMTDGTNNSNSVLTFASGTSNISPTVVFEFDYTEDQGPTTFKIQARSTTAANAVAIIGIDNSNKFSVYYYPSASETLEAIKVDSANFLAEARFFGANPTITGSTPVPFANASLQIDNTKGPVGIACSDGSLGTTTCATGTEHFGYWVTIPHAGRFKIESGFPLSDAASINDVVARIVETNADGSSVLKEGAAVCNVGVNASAGHNMPCELTTYFDFNSAGLKYIRIFGATNSTSASVVLDRAGTIATGTFSRDGYIRVTAAGSFTNHPILLNSVTTSVDLGIKSEACSVNNNGTATIGSSAICDPWVQSVSRTALGNVTVTPKAGVFSGDIVCTCSTSDLSARLCAITSGVGSPITVNTFNTGAVAEDRNFNISCKGAR